MGTWDTRKEVIDVSEIEDRIREVRDEVVGWRRHLHRHPELGLQERETSRFVHETLESFGGLELSRPTETGVVARLFGGASGEGRVIALRADMDALPIREETGLPFASENEGVMHACGHDGHTAYLLGAAKVLAGMRDGICGEIRFVFQPAEESLGGAEKMVEAGVMEGVDVALGTHLAGRLPVGKIGVSPGSRSASVDTFEIVVEGESGHAARPHEAVDAVAVAAQVVAALQHVVSRETDPLESVVVSVTKINGGTATNVIAPRVEMEGTVRSLSDEAREDVPARMERVVDGIARAHGASASFEFHRGPGPVVNDEDATAVVDAAAREVFGEEAVVRVPPSMGGEDFSAYRAVVPSTTFALVGSANEEKGTAYPNHHPRFDIDEDALQNGVRLFVHSALKLLDAGDAHDGRAAASR